MVPRMTRVRRFSIGIEAKIAIAVAAALILLFALLPSASLVSGSAVPAPRDTIVAEDMNVNATTIACRQLVLIPRWPFYYWGNCWRSGGGGTF
jgi:hypothetical protein